MGRDPLPTVDQLATVIEASVPGELERVRAAVATADELGARGDAVVTRFVEAARAAGCSWSQIGAELGVSKQAAQQAFVAPPRRRRFGRRLSHAQPFERFADGGRAVIARAQQEAAALGQGYLGTEHLLLGILASGEGVGAAALAQLGVGLQAVRDQVEAIVGLGIGAANSFPMTARTKKVLELATAEADRRKDPLVDTEHLLLALVAEGEGVAALILVKLGADLYRVRRTVLDLLED